MRKSLHIFCFSLFIFHSLPSLGAGGEGISLYTQHFPLDEVTLLDSPLKTAMERNNQLLLEYDTDRLLTPFVRQAGLSSRSGSPYYRWTEKHPSFPNWGLSDWSLEGHVGGHYLTALSLAYAATDDAAVKAQMKERVDYILTVLKDCQDAFDGNTEGMEGFIGGQPINWIWTGLYQGDLAPFRQYGGWVPFYCQHKVLAALRDAWVYTGSTLARDLFRKMCDWSVNVVSNLTTAQMQEILGWEHGGMNEPLADASLLFGEKKYLEGAKKYSHQEMLNGMQTLNTTFLDGRHANTQVPKYIGFERIYQAAVESEVSAKRFGSSEDSQNSVTTYQQAAHNFWQDVVQNRTVCIGGNSVSEHFLAANRCAQYMENLEGPESCNSNNMLKLSEILFNETHDACYADFYESTMWNHILSTQDPQTGGYVYFTSLRPQSYRIYSQVNQGMWCCVGTGMENHAKYGHFIYTHSEDNSMLYINLFTPSRLQSELFAVTQETNFPDEPSTRITIDKPGNFTLAVRHPAWTTSEYGISVNGVASNTTVAQGTAGYVMINRQWERGDVVEVSLPMELRYEPCPNYTDYIAFKYGPILLAAQTSETLALPNEYAGEGRMDHSPGARAESLPLSSAPLLIGPRSSVLERIVRNEDSSTLSFTLQVNKGKWEKLELVPFYTIHHARYSCYFYQQTEEVFAESDMGRHDAIDASLAARTLDFVGTGEQQSEVGHQANYSSDSGSGNFRGEIYRDTQAGGYIQYVLTNTTGQTDSIAVMCRFTTADQGREATIYVEGEKLCDFTIPDVHSQTDENGFYNEEFPIPSSLLVHPDGTPKSQIVFRIVASGTTPCPGLYYVRLLNHYDAHDYRFVAQDWVTGDAARVRQSDICYDSEENTITVTASGNNNVCLMLDYTHCEYNVDEKNRFLVVKGNGFSTDSGKSYLWWLNGVNKASSVVPTYTGRAADGEQVLAWELDETGLDANCHGSRWSVCLGMTIFGLTAPTGKAVISYIGFQSSVEDYLAAVGLHTISASPTSPDFYNLQGQRVYGNYRGVVVGSGKKFLLK